MDALKWLPMDTTPRDTRYICLKPKPEHTFYTCPQVMRWDEDFNGWWLEEGAVYSDDDFIGWYPIPQ